MTDKKSQSIAQEVDKYREINERNSRAAQVLAAARAVLANGGTMPAGAANLLTLTAGQEPDLVVQAEIDRLVGLYVSTAGTPEGGSIAAEIDRLVTAYGKRPNTTRKAAR